MNTSTSFIFSLQTMEDSCLGCKKLWDLLTRELSELIDFNDSSAGNNCSSHIPLAQWIDAKHPIFRAGEYVLYYHSNLTIWTLDLVKNKSISNHPGKGRILDPDWVDIDLLSHWRDMCSTTHGAKCENPMKIWPTQPAWLIDVKNQCLIRGQDLDQNTPYIALSYRCGASRQFRITEESTLTKLRIPNSLNTLEVSPPISPMIRHAMHLTTVLGKRFLWADVLCIPHCYREVAAEQLRLMGAIYAHAFITIIAMDTDSEEGIPGIRGISDSRQLKQKVIPFGTERIVARPFYDPREMFAPQIYPSIPYNGRGWTYQESLMPCRKLIFYEKMIIWECSCSFLEEEMGTLPNNSGSTERDVYRRVASAHSPDMSALIHMLSDFNDRELSYDEDALPAITGMLSVVSRSMGGSFLYGLPESIFDSALGWYPPIGSYMRRRKGQEPGSSPNHDRVQLTPCGLPSWSWIGWKGRFNESRWDTALIDEYSDTIRETFPITNWFTAQSPTATNSKRRPIFPTWLTDREGYKDLSKPLPPGWTRHDASEQGGSIVYPDGCGQFIFKHNALGGQSKRWYYPFPVADISASTAPPAGAQTAYLFCKTHKARLQAREAVDGSRFRIDLFDAKYGSIGSLHPSTWKHLMLFLEAPEPVAVELVAISRFKSYERQLRTDSGSRVLISEKMAVLSVLWENGIAYRLGYGEVQKEKWEELPLEPIDLVLG
ncbi:heterokaryon incompatibility protein-domain-containing protein [Nemania abortiva]|nr:heterokaryon incompatibility protein-domain-containing protein [Nemania abortiva]